MFKVLGSCQVRWFANQQTVDSDRRNGDSGAGDRGTGDRGAVTPQCQGYTDAYLPSWCVAAGPAAAPAAGAPCCLGGAAGAPGRPARARARRAPHPDRLTNPANTPNYITRFSKHPIHRVHCCILYVSSVLLYYWLYV